MSLIFWPISGIAASHPIFPWSDLMSVWEWIVLSVCIPGLQIHIKNVGRGFIPSEAKACPSQKGTHPHKPD